MEWKDKKEGRMGMGMGWDEQTGRSYILLFVVACGCAFGSNF